jgi:hypothetical protein
MWSRNTQKSRSMKIYKAIILKHENTLFAVIGGMSVILTEKI